MRVSIFPLCGIFLLCCSSEQKDTAATSHDSGNSTADSSDDTGTEDSDTGTEDSGEDDTGEIEIPTEFEADHKDYKLQSVVCHGSAPGVIEADNAIYYSTNP